MEDEKSITIGGRCQYIKENGQQCEAKCMTGSPYCFFHNPASQTQRLAAQRRGGIARHGSTGELGTYQIRNPLDILQVLQDCLNEVYSLESSASKGKTIAYITQVLLRGLELVSLDQRIKALEDKVFRGK